VKKSILFMVLVGVIAATFAFTGCGITENSESASNSTAQASTAVDSSVASSTAAQTSVAEVDISWDKVKEKGEFVLGLDESFPPMGFRDDSNEIVGYDVDLAKEVALRLGVKLKLQPINWDTKDQELNTGNIDCIWNGFTIKEDRKVNILFSDPYMNNQQVLVVMADASYNSQADLAGKTVALQAGSSAADALNSKADFKKSLKEVVELPDNTKCLMDLQTGNADAVVMDEIVARYFVKMKGDKYKILNDGLAAEEYGIGFRKADVQLTTKINATLKEMAKDGKIAEISNKWFGKDISTIAK
jgi:polar amino acid transport system substrate-binding protein